MEIEITKKEKSEMDNAWKEVAQAADLVLSYNNRLLNVIKHYKGEVFYKKLIALFDECEVGGGIFPHPLAIARKKSGNFQREIIPHYVDQYVNGGMEGDSFEGYIYVKLKNNRYIQAHYSM